MKKTGSRDKKAKFIELANKRVNRALKEISLIGNLANRKNYDYDDEQAKKILKALQGAIDQMKSAFNAEQQARESTFELT